MLNACANTHTQIVVLWWFMCDREWLTLFFFLRRSLCIWVFGPCLHFFSFNLTCYFTSFTFYLFRLFLSLSLTLWLDLVIGHCIQMMTTISCCCFLLLCVYLTLTFLLCFCCARTHCPVSVPRFSLSLCYSNFSLIWCAHFLCCCFFCGGCVQCVCV